MSTKNNVLFIECLYINYACWQWLYFHKSSYNNVIINFYALRFVILGHLTLVRTLYPFAVVKNGYSSSSVENNWDTCASKDLERGQEKRASVLANDSHNVHRASTYRVPGESLWSNTISRSITRTKVIYGSAYTANVSSKCGNTALPSAHPRITRGEVAISPPFLDGNGPSSPDYNSNSIKSRGSLPERVTLLQ